jgi:hypothetical protein
MAQKIGSGDMNTEPQGTSVPVLDDTTQTRSQQNTSTALMLQCRDKENQGRDSQVTIAQAPDMKPESSNAITRDRQDTRTLDFIILDSGLGLTRMKLTAIVGGSRTPVVNIKVPLYRIC